MSTGLERMLVTARTLELTNALRTGSWHEGLLHEVAARLEKMDRVLGFLASGEYHDGVSTAYSDKQVRAAVEIARHEAKTKMGNIAATGLGEKLEDRLRAQGDVDEGGRSLRDALEGL